MQYDNIIGELKANCPFPQFFEEPDQLPMLGTGYRRKLVHIRADYDGRKWWNTIWTYHDDLATPEMRKEVDAVYAALTAQGAFPNLSALTAFCLSHPEARVNDSRTDEFNFYLEGELCCYWLRCITREKDYNLYLHAFLKSAPAALCVEDVL
ncbi:hypothetical protein DSECCO2_531520 [anaerobic digester metagenome]